MIPLYIIEMSYILYISKILYNSGSVFVYTCAVAHGEKTKQRKSKVSSCWRLESSSF